MSLRILFIMHTRPTLAQLINYRAIVNYRAGAVICIRKLHNLNMGVIRVKTCNMSRMDEWVHNSFNQEHMKWIIFMTYVVCTHAAGYISCRICHRKRGGFVDDIGLVPGLDWPPQWAHVLLIIFNWAFLILYYAPIYLFRLFISYPNLHGEKLVLRALGNWAEQNKTLRIGLRMWMEGGSGW